MNFLPFTEFDSDDSELKLKFVSLSFRRDSVLVFWSNQLQNVCFIRNFVVCWIRRERCYSVEKVLLFTHVETTK